jgi:hypothetical protein
VTLRPVQIATTLPLFAGAALAWWFGQEVLATICAFAGVLLALLQWMTVRALQHNLPPDRPGGGSLADRERGPI